MCCAKSQGGRHRIRPTSALRRGREIDNGIERDGDLAIDGGLD
jgi:hypothetical protein